MNKDTDSTVNSIKNEINSSVNSVTNEIQNIAGVLTAPERKIVDFDITQNNPILHIFQN